MVSGDWHLGEHDPAALGIFFEAVLQHQPEKIVLLGDILDCTSLYKADRGKVRPLSPYRNPLRMIEEVLLARSLVAALRGIAPKAEILFMEGNHEFRWARDVSEFAAPLAEFVPSLPVALQLEEQGIRWVGAKQLYYLDEWMLKHGHRTNTHAGRSSLLESGRSVIQGHTHRLKVYAQTFEDGRQVWGLEAGHLRCTKAGYMELSTPDWQQGWVTLARSGSLWLPNLCPIVQGRCVCMGVDVSNGAAKGKVLMRNAQQQIYKQHRDVIQKVCEGRLGEFKSLFGGNR
jgi:predicted phosphodiesterase